MLRMMHLTQWPFAEIKTKKQKQKQHAESECNVWASKHIQSMTSSMSCLLIKTSRSTTTCQGVTWPTTKTKTELNATSVRIMSLRSARCGVRPQLHKSTNCGRTPRTQSADGLLRESAEKKRSVSAFSPRGLNLEM